MNAGGNPTGACSGNYLLDHSAGHISEPLITSVVPKEEPLMIEPNEMEDCGVEVIDRDRIDDGAEAELVRGTVNNSTLHAASSQPHGKAIWIMVAAFAALR